MAFAIADLSMARPWWGHQPAAEPVALHSDMYRIDVAGAPSVVLAAHRIRVSGRDLLLENRSRRRWSRERVFTLSTVENVFRREQGLDGRTTWRALDLCA